MDLEFLPQNNNPTHLHLNGGYKKTVSFGRGFLVKAVESGLRSHSGQVTWAPGWWKALCKRVRGPNFFPPWSQPPPLPKLVAPSAKSTSTTWRRPCPLPSGPPPHLTVILVISGNPEQVQINVSLSVISHCVYTCVVYMFSEGGAI